MSCSGLGPRGHDPRGHHGSGFFISDHGGEDASLDETNIEEVNGSKVQILGYPIITQGKLELRCAHLYFASDSLHVLSNKLFPKLLH